MTEYERTLEWVVAELDKNLDRKRAIIAERDQEMYRLYRDEGVKRSKLARMSGLSWSRVGAILTEQERLYEALAEQLKELGPRSKESEAFVLTEPSPEFLALTAAYRKQLEAEQAANPDDPLHGLRKLDS